MNDLASRRAGSDKTVVSATPDQLADLCNHVIAGLVAGAEQDIEVFAADRGIIVTSDTKALLRSLLILGFHRGVTYAEAHALRGYSAADALIDSVGRRGIDIVESPGSMRQCVAAITEELEHLEKE
jgi:hypothetical protein